MLAGHQASDASSSLGPRCWPVTKPKVLGRCWLVTRPQELAGHDYSTEDSETIGEDAEPVGEATEFSLTALLSAVLAGCSRGV